MSRMTAVLAVDLTGVAIRVVDLTGEENAVQVAEVPTLVEAIATLEDPSADLETKVPKAGHKKRRYRVATTYYPCCLPALGEFAGS